jgi:hypothetical protein
MLSKQKKLLFWLGIAMFVKIFGSAYYMIATASFGTPFKDSLSEDQLKLKQEQARRRGKVYAQGLVVGAIVAYVLF